MSGGALRADGRWIRPRRGFLFPVKALSAVFRGKFVAGLKQTSDSGVLTLAGSTAASAEAGQRARLLAALYGARLVVYAMRPFAGPEQVLQYLLRTPTTASRSDAGPVSTEAVWKRAWHRV